MAPHDSGGGRRVRDLRRHRRRRRLRDDFRRRRKSATTRRLFWPRDAPPRYRAGWLAGRRADGSPIAPPLSLGTKRAADESLQMFAGGGGKCIELGAPILREVQARVAGLCCCARRCCRRRSEKRRDNNPRFLSRSLARASQPAATSGGQQVAAKCAARRPAAGQRAAEMTGRARARPSSAHLHFIARDPSRASSAELRASARGCFQRVLSRDCCRRRRRRCSSCYSATTGWLRVTQQRGAIM